jgi:hypothetical protein
MGTVVDAPAVVAFEKTIEFLDCVNPGFPGVNKLGDGCWLLVLGI